ncbi:unnamed protein product, partial [Laminaria digitata]
RTPLVARQGSCCSVHSPASSVNRRRDEQAHNNGHHAGAFTRGRRRGARHRPRHAQENARNSLVHLQEGPVESGGRKGSCPASRGALGGREELPVLPSERAPSHAPPPQGFRRPTPNNSPLLRNGGGYAAGSPREGAGGDKEGRERGRGRPGDEGRR